MPKDPKKVGDIPIPDPYRESPKRIVENLVQAGLLTPEDLLVIAYEIKDKQQQIRESIALATAETGKNKELSPEQQEILLKTLKARFEANMQRHKRMKWSKVEEKLRGNPEKMWSLNEMERTGGDPDVLEHRRRKNEYVFYDCSEESPEGRRNLCYDSNGQKDAEKKGKEIRGNAVDVATAMGVQILTVDKYERLQENGISDKKTWSWLKKDENGTHKVNGGSGRLRIIKANPAEHSSIMGFRCWLVV